MAVRLDMANQTQTAQVIANGCTFRRVELPSEMPADLSEQLDPYAWGSFKERVDREWGEYNKCAIVVFYGAKLGFMLVFVGIAIFVILTVGGGGVGAASNDAATLPGVSGMATRNGLIWGVGLAIVMGINVLVRILRCKLRRLVPQIRTNLMAICIETGSKNPGLTFVVNSQWAMGGELLYIEVSGSSFGQSSEQTAVIVGEIVGEIVGLQQDAPICSTYGQAAAGADGIAGVRYVKVQQTTDWLQISSLEVLSPSGENLALNKQATSSGAGWGTDAMSPVRGAPGVRPYQQGYHSSSMGGWWMVDLGGECAVSKVVFYNRGDSFQDRARTAMVQLLSAQQKVLTARSLNSDLVQTLVFN